MKRGTVKKKAHTATFKFKVALEAVKGDKTSTQLAQEFGVVSSQIFKWKKDLLENGGTVFEGILDKQKSYAEVEKLHATIGRLKVQNDFLEHVLGRN